MHWRHGEPNPYNRAETGAVTVLESESGVDLDAALERWLSQARHAGARTWRLPCAPQAGGIWTGVGELIESLIPEIEQAAPDLVAAHGYEISLVVPRLRGQLDVCRPLTDTAAPDERTRNYPADRAYRSLHGLVDLLSAWHARSGGPPWAMVCDEFDRANGLVQRFFRELIRRRGHALGLQLLVSVGPERGGHAVTGFRRAAVAGAFRPSWPGQATAVPAVADAEEMGERAAALEEMMKAGAVEEEIALPRIIHYWQQSSEPERALPWQVTAIHAFNHLGLYEASLEYADAVEANLDRIRADDAYQYFLAVNGLFFCWVPLGQAERARLVLESALAHLEPSTLPRVLYLVAMLHARFLERKDVAQAESYLQQALDLVARVGLPKDDREFMTVFLMNGLALIRVRQGRAQDALDLCQAGLDRLDEHLDPDQHRLHRSVLVYNIAQVYAQIGPNEKAIRYFGQTMALDPNYSEYYNDRGSVLLKMGRFGEAEQDFLRAIELSPPYPEVWVNLGQCYRAMGRMSEAVRAYSRALDLEPGSGLAWAGRADAYASLGQGDDAVEDYRQALRLDSSEPLVWAGRAVVYYEQGRVGEALDDLDRAVALAPDMGELRQNRAVARQDLGLMADAVADLRSYLELCPEADDRAEVEQQLQSLLVAAS